jgi:hypothetical protein
MIEQARDATDRAIREAGGDEDTSYITEDLMLEYMGEASEVTEKDVTEHAGRRATAEDVPAGVVPEALYVMYGWNVFRVGYYVYFQIVGSTNACTAYKRRMYNASMSIVGSANCGRTKYQIVGWYAPQAV